MTTKAKTAEIPGPFPKRESLKNKSGISDMFLTPEKHQPIHHKSPRFHHEFTTKKPRFTTHFFKNPLQKRENSLK
jgi:hypothetical protein